MNFHTGSSIDGAYEFGYETGWHWSKNKGSYATGCDFFWIHWEIRNGAPNNIKFHVEAPKSTVDAELNNIKQEMVMALLSPRFNHIAEQNNFHFKLGNRIKPEHLEKNKSTQVFQILLTDEQQLETHQANIILINDLMREALNEVIRQFNTRLIAHFP